MTPESPAADVKNADVSWDAFDPEEYIKHNYIAIQPVDREILTRVRDHFRDHFRGSTGRVRAGIDVGAGPNLYPALAMLPWCDRITLLERSAANLGYLESQLPGYDANWDQFWDVLRERPEYADPGLDPRTRFAEAVGKPVAGSLFDLCGGDERWDLGTMFFVAESITASLREFRDGVGCFLRSLNPGAPFAAAFMEHSEGYSVGAEKFPARDIDSAEVTSVLADYAEGVRIHRMANPKHLVRTGYTGMILACGRRKD
ncbi:SCO2525 family SAM-dependent methyltransferase [Streptomyces sp. NPDC003247]|uniref:SCO2525 family SAM-dependent methyltransferase n=1 Tax=Streptomyces sp. NPDC003247 TaxID=3364677 RepID=UPI00367F55E8